MRNQTIKWFCIPLLLVVVFVHSCKTSQMTKNSESIANTRFYYGEVKTTSPVGKIPYGPVKYSLVKRIIDPSKGTIVELVKQGDKLFNTILTQTKSENIFEVSDKNKSFTGTIIFNGEKWRWTTWTYNIKMADGSGKIIGTGRLQNKLLSTNKKFLSPDGTEKVLIVEELKEISEAEYNSKNK